MAYTDVLGERRRLVISYTGKILMGSSLIYILPLLLLPFYPQESVYAVGFLIPAAVALLKGYIMSLQEGSKQEGITVKEGSVIIVVAWILTIIISALPFLISGGLNFTQAVFEAVSGWTTTGLSVVDVQKTPRIILFWRSIMQFFGGAGLAVVMLSAIIGPYGFGLFSAEGREDIIPNVVKSAKFMMIIYTGYFVVGSALYMEAGMSAFEAINHSASAISTGGFSTRVGSIGEYESLNIELITILLMLLGSINFGTHYMLMKGEARRFFRLGEIRLSAFLLAFFIPLVFFFSASKLYESFGKAARVSFFELISAFTTTGYSSVSYGGWDDFGILVLMLLMIIGGGTCSTAGGLKQYRVLLLIKTLHWNMARFFAPKNVIRHEYIERAEGPYEISSEHIINTACFTIMYIMLYLAGVAVLTINGYSLRDSMFEFASAMSTVGLSMGITSPNAPEIVLWTESAGMFLGRLEFFVVFYGIVNLVKLSYVRNPVK